jgi:hypothetical protein
MRWMPYGMGTFKIPLRSIRSEEGPHYRRARKLSKTGNNQPIHDSDILWWFHTRAVLRSLANARKVSSRIFVRKKGMNHAQSNRRSQQTPSAKFGKEKIRRLWCYYQVPTSVLLWETNAFCSRNMGAHVWCTNANKLVSSDYAKTLKIATKKRETCEKTFFTPPSPTKATNSIISV